jgi:hypothetical protein
LILTGDPDITANVVSRGAARKAALAAAVQAC